MFTVTFRVRTVRGMHKLVVELCKLAEKYGWEHVPSLEWREGREGAESYHYLLYGEVEIPIREHMEYEFSMCTGELVSVSSSE